MPPLEMRTADVALRFGLDESVDPHADPQGALVLRNMRYTKDGALVRRPGFSRQSATPAMSGGYGLVKAGEAIGILTDSGVYPTGAGTPPANIAPAQIRDSSVPLTGTTGANVLSVDSTLTTISSVRYIVLAAVCWSEREANTATPTTECWVWVHNYDTGEPVFKQRVSVAGNPLYARVITHANGEVSLVYTTSSGSTTGNVLYRVVNIASRTLGSLVTLTNDAWVQPIGLNAHPCTVDVCRGRGNDIVVASVSVASSRPRAQAVSATGTITTSAVAAGAIVAGSGPVGVTMTTGSGGGNQIAIAYAQSSDGAVCLSTFAYTATLTWASSVVVDTMPARVVTLFSQVGTGSLFVLYESLATTVVLNITALTMNADGSVGGEISSQTYPLLTLASKAQWLGAPISRWVVAASSANTQSNPYKAVWLIAVADATQPLFPSAQAMATLSNEDARTPYPTTAPVAGGPQFLATSLNTLGSTARMQIAFPSDLESNSATQVAPATTYGSAFTEAIRRWKVVESAARTTGTAPAWTELNGVAYLCGSALLQFDGTTLTEAAFLTAPGAPVVVAGAGTTLAAGNYAYCLVLETTDALGNIRVSPPSANTLYTVTGAGDGTPSVTITNNAISFVGSTETQAATQFRAKLYRTQRNGSTFNLVWTCILPPGLSVVYRDTATDVAAATGETLYTTGGVLESEPPPMLRHITTHRNRLVGVRSDSNAVAFTKEVTPPLLPQWNAELEIRVDNDAGPPIAVASLDDKLIIFQADQILICAGEGPDNLGNGGFTTPERVHVGAGVTPGQECSVVAMPMGIMFRHRSGYYLLSRSLEVSKIGDAVRDQVEALGTVQSARYMPSEQQVWITGASSRDVLVFDALRSRWSLYVSNAYATSTAVAGVVERDGTVYFLGNTAGVLYALVPNQTVDNDGGTNLDYLEVIELPWFRGATGHGGMQRVWKIQIAVVVMTADAQQLVLKTYTAREDKPYKGSDSPSDNVFTWVNNPSKPWAAGHLVLVAHLRVQRCDSCKVRIEINNRTITGTLQTQAGLRLVNVRYLYGAIGEGKTPTRPTVTAGA
jgi:hypothetical protein